MLCACSVRVDNFPWIGSHPVWTSIWHSSQGWELLCESSFSVCACTFCSKFFSFSSHRLIQRAWSSADPSLRRRHPRVRVKMPPATGGPVGYTPPEGGWGWAVVVGAFISIGFSYAFPKSITVFFKEIEVIFNATSSQVSWISSIMLAVMYAGGQFHLLLSLLSILVLYLFISLWVLNWEFYFLFIYFANYT